jgi:RNA ligase (TIGR02306 family)
MGITKYDPQAQEEKALSVPKHQNKVLRYLMNFKAFRTVYLKLNQKENGWPVGVVSKTDEENIQNMYNVISENFEKSFYVTEKLEGQSATFYTTFEKHWGFNRKVFGVCSRNIKLEKPDNSKYWQTAKRYDLEKVLKSYKCRVAIQGEQVGEGIQGNIYKLTGVDLFVFNVYMDGKRLGVDELKAFCDKHGLTTVPVLDANFVPSKEIVCNTKDVIVHYLLGYSNGTSVLYKTMREGVVLRLNENPSVSVKARSPDYLIKHEE